MTSPHTQAEAHAERTSRVQAAANALAGLLDASSIAGTALSAARAVFGASAGVVAVLNQDGTRLELLANQGFADEPGATWQAFPAEVPHPFSEALRRGESVWVGSHEAYAARFSGRPANPAYAAWVAVPLRMDGGGLGVLGLAFTAPQTFADEDRALASTLATHCAQAISRARLYAATLRAADRLARLQSLTGLLSQAVSAAQVADMVVNQVVLGIGSAAGALLTMRPDGTGLELLSSRGVSPGVHAASQFVPLEAEHPAADVVRTGRAFWLASNSAVRERYPSIAALYSEAGYETLAALPLIVRGTALGALILADQTPHQWAAEDRAYILAVAHQCALALDRAQLYESLEARVQARTAELEREVAERRRVEAQLRGFSAYLHESLEEERTRISRQVHDELGGALTGIKMGLKRLQAHLPDNESGAAQVAWLADYTDELVDVVRRIASDLRPAVLDDLGLVPALEWQLEAFQKQSGLACRIDVQATPTPVPSEVGTAVFRIIKECLTNILRHAEAQTVTLIVREKGPWLSVVIQDDGRGVTPERLNASQSLGVLGMRERARLVGGDVEIESQPGQGTVVRVRVPLSLP